MLTRLNQICLLALLFSGSLAFADGQGAAVESPGGSTIKRDYLPGEEVTTASGKKLKVWSTRGPVEVSQAPEPFESEDEKRLPPLDLYVEQPLPIPPTSGKPLPGRPQPLRPQRGR